MPIQTQGSEAHFSLDVRNSSGDFTDPSNLSFTFRDSLGGHVAPFPVAYPGAIVKDTVGQFHYDWTIPLGLAIGNYSAYWAGILLGAPTSALELWQIAPAGSMTTSGLDFLLKPDDYDAIRGLLGVTTLDIEDTDIELVPFGPAAELHIKRRVSNWATQVLDTHKLFPLRMAAIYRVAYEMSISYVHGGLIGLASERFRGENRNWVLASAQFLAGYQYWLDIADESDIKDENTADYEIRPIFNNGPTRRRNMRMRRGQMIYDPWVASLWGFPPPSYSYHSGPLIYRQGNR